MSEQWVRHPDPDYRNPDPDFHHSFCQFRRDGGDCTCAEGRETRRVGPWVALDPADQPEVEQDLLDLPASRPQYADNVVVRSGRAWRWVGEVPA